jgi:hypothetical protein
MADVFVDHIIACDYCRSFPSKLCIEGREKLEAAMAEKELGKGKPAEPQGMPRSTG